MRILVADDDPVTTELLKGFLVELGHEVETADNGRDAFDMVCQDDYRIVVSDWQMPEMTGLELCRRLRQRQFGAYVYVILITAQKGRSNLVRGLQAGADDFLTKPIAPDELQVRLRTAPSAASASTSMR